MDDSRHGPGCVCVWCVTPVALRHDESVCPGCGEIVPDVVAYSDGPRPFHWNDQGGGHTMDPTVYVDGEYVGGKAKHLS